MKKIPIRPNEIISGLNQSEMNALTWSVISGCRPEEAFLAFCRPDLAANKALLSRIVPQFFSSEPAISYVTQYRKVLEGFLSPEPKKKANLTDEEKKKQKLEAVQKIVDWVIKNADNIDAMEHPEELIKVMNRLGMFGEDEVQEEKPRRYLPESCNECRYKKFIDENCEEIEE